MVPPRGQARSCCSTAHGPAAGSHPRCPRASPRTVPVAPRCPAGAGGLAALSAAAGAISIPETRPLPLNKKQTIEMPSAAGTWGDAELDAGAEGAEREGGRGVGTVWAPSPSPAHPHSHPRSSASPQRLAASFKHGAGALERHQAVLQGSSGDHGLRPAATPRRSPASPPTASPARGSRHSPTFVSRRWVQRGEAFQAVPALLAPWRWHVPSTRGWCQD